MRISDWSSDVCSSDLLCALWQVEGLLPALPRALPERFRVRQRRQAAWSLRRRGPVRRREGQRQGRLEHSPHVARGRRGRALRVRLQQEGQVKQEELRIGEEGVRNGRSRWAG